MAQTRKDFLATIGQQTGERGRASKWDPAYCEKIMLLAQAGDFPEAWAAEIGVSVETLRLWGHAHPEFREALIAAKHLLYAYWTREIAANRNNPRANSAMYALVVRRLPALFGREPVDLVEYVTHDDDAPAAGQLTAENVKTADTSELEARLEALRRRREEEQG